MECSIVAMTRRKASRSPLDTHVPVIPASRDDESRCRWHHDRYDRRANAFRLHPPGAGAHLSRGAGPHTRSLLSLPVVSLDEPDPLLLPWVWPALDAFLDTSPTPAAGVLLRVAGRHGLEAVAGCRPSVGRRPGSRSRPRSPVAIVYVLRDPLAAALHALHGCASTVLVLDVTAQGARLSPAAVPPALAGAGLSAREIDVLALLLARRTNTEIAATLGVAPTTVRSHCRALLRKLGAGDRRALWRLVAAISPAPPPPAITPASKFAEDCGVAAAADLRDNPELRQGDCAAAGHTAGETCGYLRSGAADESSRRRARERDERSLRA